MMYLVHNAALNIMHIVKNEIVENLFVIPSSM